MATGTARQTSSGQVFGGTTKKASLLSEKARGLGLKTRDDVEREFLEAKSGWSKGTLYHCPFCDKEFWSDSGARKHMKTNGHPVLRWDWY